MSPLFDVLCFALKGLVVVMVIAALAVIVALQRRRRRPSGRLEVESLNAHVGDLRAALHGAVLSGRKLKERRRRDAKAEKLRRTEKRRRVYVVDVNGDSVEESLLALRSEVTAIVEVAESGDEVLIRIDSPGGAVHLWGLAAAQVMRLKARGIRTVACIDKIAASGGYMVAAVTDAIVAAPFAIVGSIGVVAQVPNLHRVLQKHGIDYEEMTAGKYKRTVSVLGPISAEGRQRFQEHLEDTHGLFKDLVQEHRPAVDLAKVATGEYWFGSRAIALGLVDQLMTSDDYLLAQMPTADLYRLTMRSAPHLGRRLARLLRTSAASVIGRLG